MLKHLESSGVEVYVGVGTARFVDSHTVALGDGRQLSAERFILCVGGHARRLPFPGAEHALTHGDLWNLRQLPQRLAVVGGAATGCQLAAIMNTFGSQVTLLDVAPHILPIEDAAVTEALTKAFTDRGITIVSGMSGVERVEKTGDGLKLSYKRDDEVHAIEVDAVIVAVGWPGNVDDLNLEAAGVRVERNYIAVDDTLRTSAGHIFAAGDINGRMMLCLLYTSSTLTSAPRPGDCLAHRAGALAQSWHQRRSASCVRPSRSSCSVSVESGMG